MRSRKEKLKKIIYVSLNKMKIYLFEWMKNYGRYVGHIISKSRVKINSDES